MEQTDLPALPECAGEPSVRPKEWTQYCGDAGFWLYRLRWTAWTSTSAVATGVGVPTKGCDSICGREYPLEVRIDAPRHIAGFGAQPLFTRIRITYKTRGPGGQRTEAGSLRDVWESALSNR